MWQGRELRFFGTDDGYVEYRYNQDGLRCQKIFEEDGTGLEDRYDYYWTDDCRLQGYTVTAAGSDEPYSVLVLYNSAHEAIGFTVGEDTYYYIKNIQGDVLTVTDSAGTPIINYTYDAWGAMTITPASQNVNSQTVAEVAFLNPVTYRGYFYDAELGLYYLQSRYYDPEMGRFLNMDIYSGTENGIVGTNVFVYCNNCPSMQNDLGGEKPSLLYKKYISRVTQSRTATNVYTVGIYYVYFGFKFSKKLYWMLASSFVTSRTVTVNDNVVKLPLNCFANHEEDCKKWRSFVQSDSRVQRLIEGIIECYMSYYNCAEMPGRSVEGLTMEFFVHLYAYYFLEKGRSHTQEVDFDSQRSNFTDWQHYEKLELFSIDFPDIARTPIVAEIKKALSNDKESYLISFALKEYMKKQGWD